MIMHVMPVLVVATIEFVATNVFVATADTKRLLKTNGHPTFMQSE